MPRCNNFGDWTAVEGLMRSDSEDRGHVLFREDIGFIIVGSFPTYEEAVAYVKERSEEPKKPD